VAWKTLHAFAGHRKSASPNSTATHGKPRNHTELPETGTCGGCRRRPRSPGAPQQPGLLSRNRNLRHNRVRSAADVAKHSTPRPLPGPAFPGIRAGRRRRDPTHRQAEKNVLKIQHQSSTPPLLRSRPRPAGAPGIRTRPAAEQQLRSRRRNSSGSRHRRPQQSAHPERR
jgi:hypothetical protein